MVRVRVRVGARDETRVAWLGLGLGFGLGVSDEVIAAAELLESEDEVVAVAGGRVDPQHRERAQDRAHLVRVRVRVRD